jgi:hypothetical protein
MLNRRLHKVIGATLLLPVFAWAATGVFFLFRPAYDEAYASLGVKTYPLTSQLELPLADQWLEFRYLETVLGEHLLVRTASGWQHLKATTGAVFVKPTGQELEALVTDAISQDPSRYGEIISLQDGSFLTSTGVLIGINWPSLSLTQVGEDTRWINRIYDIHYLRWSGIDWLDEIIGGAGLFLLILMAITGARLLFGAPSANTRRP